MVMLTFEPLASSSDGNAYVVTGGDGTKLLIEAGLPFNDLKRRMGFGLSGVAGCLITHEHADHARAARNVADMGVNIHMSAGTATAVGMDRHHRFRPLFTGTQVAIGGWQVMPFETVHDADEPLGFLIANGHDKLLFATDTACVRQKFNGLTHIAVECNYTPQMLTRNIQSGDVAKGVASRLIRSHMGLDEVLMFLAKQDLSQVREIWLLHLSDTNGDEAEMLDAVRGATGKIVKVAAKNGGASVPPIKCEWTEAYV